MPQSRSRKIDVMEKSLYIAPVIEVVEVAIEKGFAGSFDEWDQGVF